MDGEGAASSALSAASTGSRSLGVTAVINHDSPSPGAPVSGASVTLQEAGPVALVETVTVACATEADDESTVYVHELAFAAAGSSSRRSPPTRPLRAVGRPYSRTRCRAARSQRPAEAAEH